ncbi:MAG: hypothetical protein IKI57_02265 [Clostridia bacterium]|nr:hypothetical protein [Clostridia bacterium]
MEKYFNKAIIGNGNILACLDEKAELIRLYYPYIDYFQNIDTYSLGFVYPNGDHVEWFKYAFLVNQYYDGNIIYTKLKMNDVDILIRDYALIDKNILVRKIKFNQPLSLMVYSKVNSTPDKLVSGMCVGNSLIQYAPDFYMTTTSNHKIIKSQINNVRDNVDRADLKLEDYIGMSDDSAVLYEESKEITLYIALESELKKSFAQIEFLKKQNEEELYSDVKKYWREFLEDHLNYYIENKEFTNREIDIIERTILMYALLTNKSTGAVLASPDVDERFSKCGRYGYCWPRDALFINEAMMELGMEEDVNKFYSIWAEKTQLSNGLFEQRYYSNGELAPSWGVQIDETASMVIGISKLSNKKDYFRIVEKAVVGMINFLNENFISKPCYDLWEERKDSHLYSTGSIYYALEMGRDVLKDFPEYNHLICEIDILQPKILEAIKNEFVKDNMFVRSKFNSETDISLLGAVTPFNVVNYDDQVAINTLNKIENDLKLPNGGYLRYANDGYMGGNAWIISSLWLALYYIEAGNFDKARELYNWVTMHQDDKGFLAEQIDRNSDKPAWIVGLSWSHALYIIVGKKLH